MARTIGLDEVTVFNFEESSIVALCEEVVSFFMSGEAQQYDVDPQRFTFRRRDGMLQVVFLRL